MTTIVQTENQDTAESTPEPISQTAEALGLKLGEMTAAIQSLSERSARMETTIEAKMQQIEERLQIILQIQAATAEIIRLLTEEVEQDNVETDTEKVLSEKPPDKEAEP